MSHTAPPPSRRHSYPLHVHIATLFTALILVTGAVIGGYNYYRASALALASADERFSGIAEHVKSTLEGLVSPIRTLVHLLAHQRLIHATTLPQRLESAGFLRESLEQNPHMAAVYAGYPDGDFFLLRPLRTPELRKFFAAPPEAAYLVHSVERDGGAPADGRYLFLDGRLKVIGTVPRPDERYDPRERPWYKLAKEKAMLVRTDPYPFFSTGSVGVTVARPAEDGQAVVAADLTLDEISRALGAEKLTPSAEVAVVDGEGGVIAYRVPSRLVAEPTVEGGRPRLKPLRDLGVPILDRGGRQIGAADAGRNLVLSDGTRDWALRVTQIPARGGSPAWLLVAAPEDELLADARRMRNETVVATALVVLITIPLTWWIAHGIGRRLRLIAAEARAIRSFQFDAPDAPRSVILEVDELSGAMNRMKATIRQFLDISSALAAERNFGRLLDRVLGETVGASGAKGGIVHLLDDDERTLRAAAFRWGREARDTGALPPIPLSGGDHPLATAATAERSTVLDVPAARLTGLPLGADLPEGASVPVVAAALRNRAQEVIGTLVLVLPHDGGAPAAAQVAFIEALSGTAAVAIENQRLLQAQKDLLESLIQLIAGAIDAKSPYTGGHCQRVPELTKMLARAACDAREGPFAGFAMSEEQWEALHIAGWLHDCGKVTTPEFVVDKATKLETIHDRIHEVRMRFEVLKRDAEIACWKAVAAGGDRAALETGLAAERRALDDEFAFVAACNEGGEFMAPEKIERLRKIAAHTWQRTLDDRIGISWEEKKRKERTPAAPLPAEEPLLADRPEHVFPRGADDAMPEDNPWGFRLRLPEHKYDRGELHNLIVGRGTLTDEDRTIINDHIVQTIVMLSRLPFPKHLKRVPEIAGGHHEKMDGTGYPKRLTRGEMSPEARMMAIADIFEALTSVDRPYKKGKTLSEAIRIMGFMKKDGHVDPDLFDLFLTSGVYREYAARFLRPEQIDEVDVRQYVATNP